MTRSRRLTGAALFRHGNMTAFVRTVVLTTLLTLLPAPSAWADGTFTDDDGNVHEGYIEAIVDEGITEGCETDRYCPAEPVTRAQMATFLLRALDLPPADADHFDDDDATAHEEAINAVAAGGIVRGCGDRRYCPGEHVTRAQMATLLVAAFGLIDSEVNFFRDDNDHLHEDHINDAARAAVTQGCGGGGDDYCPGQPVQRDQMATYLAKALGLASQAEPVRTFTYQVASRGDVESDVEMFRRMVTATLSEPRGWTLDGAVSYQLVRDNANVRIWLASPQEVADAAPVCSPEYSCRVGDDIYINDERWQNATESYADRSLTAYRHYVINHELGHWLEVDHRDCEYQGASAWVMQQQSISLDGCESRVWPHVDEKDEARANLGVG